MIVGCLVPQSKHLMLEANIFLNKQQIINNWREKVKTHLKPIHFLKYFYLHHWL